MVRRMHINDDGWVRCPNCGNKTRSRINQNTTARNLPIFCPKCHSSANIDIDDRTMTVV